MPPKKFYVVWNGHTPGIYDTWAACEAQVKGYPNAQYKAFPTRQMAEAAWRESYTDYAGKNTATQQWLFASQPPVTPCLCVDAACAGVPGPVEYQGVRLPEMQTVFRQGPYPGGTNNIGEFLAIVHALAWLEHEKLAWPVYSDSETARAWVRAGKCRSEAVHTPENTALFDLVRRAEAWLATHRITTAILKWDTRAWGEIPADFRRK
ncbi:MAG: ribonuclease H family protein [Anaerolineales bacterium]